MTNGWELLHLENSPKERGAKSTRYEGRRTREWELLFLEEHPLGRGIGSMTNDELRMTNGWELLHLGNLTEREGYEKYEVRGTKDEGVGTPFSGGTPI